MNSSGFKMNSGNSEQLRNNFIKNRIKANIPKKSPVRGIGQDPIQRQATVGGLNNAMGNTLQKYKMNTNAGSNPYDGMANVDRSPAGANQFINGKTSLGETVSDMTDMFKGSGDSIQNILANYDAPQIKAKKVPKNRINRPVETPKNALSETLMRYLQGMFNGGF